MAFTQSPLPYGFNDLEPHFNASVLKTHYTKHHAGYITKLNTVLEDSELIESPLEVLVSDLSVVPTKKRAAVKQFAGQHYNHDLYWNSLSPSGGGEPTGKIADAINSQFGSFAAFKKEFNNAAVTQFGSGWAWLSLKEGQLQISSTGNEDTPLMDGAAPLLTLDVWEHAYYLQYQNRRPDFISAFWNVVNWENVNKLYEAAQG
ncbi:MAG: superoxide dismutase [Lentisphaerales bacterium]|nr:superoxide dismutase [Lentisphaerales bacterium]